MRPRVAVVGRASNDDDDDNDDLCGATGSLLATGLPPGAVLLTDGVDFRFRSRQPTTACTARRRRSTTSPPKTTTRTTRTVRRSERSCRFRGPSPCPKSLATVTVTDERGDRWKEDENEEKEDESKPNARERAATVVRAVSDVLRKQRRLPDRKKDRLRTLMDKTVSSFLNEAYPNRPKVADPKHVAPNMGDHAHSVFQHCENGNRIYLGSRSAAVGPLSVRDLFDRNVRGIVNCTTSVPCANRETLGVRYCCVPVNDVETADVAPWLGGVTDFLHAVLSEEGSSVLVHSEAGVSRSSSVVVAYLIRFRHLTLEQAYLLHVKERRPCVDPNRGFWRQLQR